MMRPRWIPFALCAALLLVLVPGPAGGAPIDPRPAVLSATWLTPPIRAHRSEVLEVVAADPNDVVTEVDVVWGDGVVTFADLVCSGRVATVRMGHQFQRRGVFVVEIVAVSSNTCTGGGRQESPPFPLPTVVL